MKEAPKPRVEEDGVPAWGKFFRKDMEDLKLRTTHLQYERLSTQELNELIGLMVLEVSKPPFNRVPKIVLQRVIHEAVVDERFLGKAIEFTGYSVKWIRQVLNAWWQLYGDKWMQKWQREDEEKASQLKPVPTTVPQEDVHKTVENYWKRLMAEGHVEKYKVPKMKPEEIKKEGAEWTSDLEHKGSVHRVSLTVEQYVMRECIQQAGSHLYASRERFNLKPFIVDGYGEVYAESQADAELMYNDAKEKFPEALKQFIKK
jgi:hypothetical protein